MEWIRTGPVSTPPPRVAAVAAALILAAGAGSLAFGVHAVWREGGPRGALADVDQTDVSQAQIAKPIVEIPSPVPQQAAANTLAANTVTAEKHDASDDSNELAAKTAEVQAVQSQPAKAAPDIDQILTSSDEKPQAPPKAAEDAAKSDVPF